jgi:2,4-didehydro-3-deoxy-L-rhamnonate hydrolase
LSLTIDDVVSALPDTIGKEGLMRLCRFSRGNAAEAGIYADSHVIPLAQARSAFEKATGRASALPENDDLLALLPPDGEARRDMDQLYAWATDHSDDLAAARLPVDSIQLLVPIPRPNKLFLLAGNYAAHIQEGGGVAAERAETFPYVFMKPPTTTLTHPGQPIRIPAVSPQHVDWELKPRLCRAWPGTR